MPEQLSEKEQLLEQQLNQAEQRLEHARTEMQSAENLHSQLQKRQATAETLDKVCLQLAELSNFEPLENVSPFDQKPLSDSNQVNQYYAGLIEGIKKQVVNYRQKFSHTESRLNSAKDLVGKTRLHVDSLADELEKSRPSVRAHKVIHIDADGVRREFVVMYRRDSLMPWSESARDASRRKKITIRTMVAIILLSIILPFVPVPERERAEVIDVPERVAQLVQEKPPPPPPPRLAKIPKKKRKDKLKPRKEAPKPKTDVAKAAREKAKQTGVLAFMDSIADLQNNNLEDKLGKQASITSGGEKARKTERSLITASASRGSGGINTSAYSRDVAGTGLSQHGTSRVTTTIGSGFGDAQRPLSDSFRGSRTDEEIQLVFDRNKSALYSIYQRALRKNPTLKGKVVLKLTIAPSGQVLKSSVASSDLGDKLLETKIAARVKLFNFGEKDVDEITITYPIDFLPA